MGELGETGILGRRRRLSNSVLASDTGACPVDRAGSVWRDLTVAMSQEEESLGFTAVHLGAAKSLGPHPWAYWKAKRRPRDDKSVERKQEVWNLVSGTKKRHTANGGFRNEV